MVSQELCYLWIDSVISCVACNIVLKTLNGTVGFVNELGMKRECSVEV
jgi:hypothetical protein